MSETNKIVVILGRVNVGKSTLFNCLTGSDEAIVSSCCGTTCDRKYGLAEKNECSFKLVDTGGVDLRSLKNSILGLAHKRGGIEIVSEFKGNFEKAVHKQTKAALNEADLSLMIVDGNKGIHPDDITLAKVLKKNNKPAILVCNKIDLIKDVPNITQDPLFLAELFKGVDKPRIMPPSEEFKELGLGEPLLVSAVNSKGIDVLSNLIIDTLQIRKQKNRKIKKQKTYNLKPIKVVMVGRSGVGKSTLFNQILGQELAVTSHIYQTTIDSHNGQLTYQGKPVLITDTPGLLQRADIRTDIDKIIHKKTIALLEKADIVLLVTEVIKGLCPTDRYLSYLANKTKTPIIIVANKWDVFPNKSQEMTDQIMIHYRDYLPKIKSAPIVFTSGKTGHGIEKIFNIMTKIN